MRGHRKEQSKIEEQEKLEELSGSISTTTQVGTCKGKQIEQCGPNMHASNGTCSKKKLTQEAKA